MQDKPCCGNCEFWKNPHFNLKYHECPEIYKYIVVFDCAPPWQRTIGTPKDFYCGYHKPKEGKG